MTSRSFVFSQAATIYPSGLWQFAAGAFTGQSRTDLFGYDAGNGTVWVGENSGTDFSFQLWATVDPVDGWQFTAGDFSGDERTDIIGYHPSNGSVWVGENLGTYFAFSQWVVVDPIDGWQFAAGDFTGHAKNDLFAYHPSNGSLWVGENTGTGFSFEQWGTVDPADGWQFVAGDFTGNGRTDVMGYHASSGSVWVGENIGTAFELGMWAAVDPARPWQFAAGHFTGRASSDVFGYDPSNGTLWVGENTGTNFTFRQWGNVGPAAGWQFVTGVFNADFWTDVAGYHPSNGGVWVGQSTLRPMEGYCWPLSASPGESIQFRLSGDGASTALVQRHTSTSNAIDAVDVMSLDFVAVAQPVPATAVQSGCEWTDTFSVTIPNGWTSGIYAASCTDAGDTSFDVTFVVKPALDNRSNIAVLANANTWLAYNGWGGESKYSGRARTSFLRPMPGASPAADFHLTRGELWILGWLSSAGYQPDVFSDLDFHNDGCDASQYACLVLSTHPEYWSRQMYDNLATYLNQGGSLLYLGGNGIYENGEYEPDQTAMTFRQGIEGGPRVTSLFRVLTPAMAERSLLGVATERCGVEGSAYRVESADHPLFAGVRVTDPVTGNRRQVVNGDLFGESGLNTGFGNGKASAWEVDTSAGVGALTVPIDCATEGSAVPDSTLPDGLVVLATGEPDAAGPGSRDGLLRAQRRRHRLLRRIIDLRRELGRRSDDPAAGAQRLDPRRSQLATSAQSIGPTASRTSSWNTRMPSSHFGLSTPSS